MSASSEKAHRREIRRAVGEGALGTIAELQANQQRLANSLTLAHQRIDKDFEIIHHLTDCVAKLEARIVQLEHGDRR